MNTTASDLQFQTPKRPPSLWLSMLPGQRCVAIALCCFAAGCAQFGATDHDATGFAIAANRAALSDAPTTSDAPASTDLSLVKVPLEGAVRRLVSMTLEDAAAGLSESAAPRAAVVLPASSTGLQPPGSGVLHVADIAAEQVAGEFAGLRLIGGDPRLLPQADWALLLQIYLPPDLSDWPIPVSEVKPSRASTLCVRVLDLNSGKVLAARRQLIEPDSVDSVPPRYFRDLPVALPWSDPMGRDEACGTASSSALSGAAIVDWRARAKVAMTFGLAVRLYGQRSHLASRNAFRELVRATDAATTASSIGGWNAQVARLHGRLGEYLATWRMVFNRGAEHLMRPLIEALFDAKGEVPLNLALSPLNADIIAGRRIKSRQTEWLIEVSRHLRRKRLCADVVGFATNDFRRNKEESAGPLGLAHANYVRRQLRRHSAFRPADIVAYAARTRGDIEVNRTGDIRDEWARRVLVRQRDCRSRIHE